MKAAAKRGAVPLLSRHRVVLVAVLVVFVALLGLVNDRYSRTGRIRTVSSVRGVSIVVATYRRAELLKLTIPRYLAVPIVQEIVISDDINSGDAEKLRYWLPSSGLSAEDQNKVKIFGDTGAKLGSYRNKVRAISLATQEWVAIMDSDNFASPEHYWAPLMSFWERTYGSSPPPPNSPAEKRSFNPGHFCRTRRLLEDACEILQNHSDVAAKCTRDGSPAPEGTPIDPLAAVGLKCWYNAVRTPTGAFFVSDEWGYV